MHALPTRRPPRQPPGRLLTGLPDRLPARLRLYHLLRQRDGRLDDYLLHHPPDLLLACLIDPGADPLDLLFAFLLELQIDCLFISQLTSLPAC